MDHFYVDVIQCPTCGRQREHGKIRIQASPCRYVRKNIFINKYSHYSFDTKLQNHLHTNYNFQNKKNSFIFSIENFRVGIFKNFMQFKHQFFFLEENTWL